MWLYIGSRGKELVLLCGLCRAASRGLVNEDELVAYISATYDVNVTKIIFKGRMEDTISIMRQSDLLIGVHGAGKYTAEALTIQKGSS